MRARDPRLCGTARRQGDDLVFGLRQKNLARAYFRRFRGLMTLPTAMLANVTVGWKRDVHLFSLSP
jgi:hypothetical protein